MWGTQGTDSAGRRSSLWFRQDIRLSASHFPTTSVWNVCSCTLFHIRRSSSRSCGTHGLRAAAAASHGPRVLIPSHSKLPFRVCFWAPSWGPGPWESRAQRAHNPIWQEMVGMPGYIHSRTHSPTWLAQRSTSKSLSTVWPVHTNTHKQVNVQLTQIPEWGSLLCVIHGTATPQIMITTDVSTGKSVTVHFYQTLTHSWGCFIILWCITAKI